MAKQQMLICPYCGEAQPLSDRCRVCRGLFEPLSRQATHNSMGPWYIRDPKRPHRPGCSYETLVRLVEREQIDRFSIIRGPTTRQFWAVAKRVPGVAHLLGYCHNCDAHVEPSHHGCPKCGVSFGAYINRNYLGLPDIRPMPWEAELDLDDQSKAQMTGATNGNGASQRTGFATTTRSAPPPNRNVGISSFATDEELTGPPPTRSYAPSAPTSSAKSVSATAADEPEFVDVPGEEPGLRESSATAAPVSATPAAPQPAPQENDRVTRSLRMAVRKQQRTIRILLIAVFAIVVLSLIVNVVMMQAMASREETNTNGSATQPENANPSKPVQPTVNATDSQENKPNPADAGAQETAPKVTPEEPIVAPEQPAADSTDDGLPEARRLLEEAGDDSRALDDRIADCEKAVALLEAMETAGGKLPADFAELLKKAKNDLERLRLAKFFP